MKLHLFDEWLRAWMQAGTVTVDHEFKVGLAEIPELHANLPYAIFTPITTGKGSGPYSDPEIIKDYVFQVLCAGKTPEQCRWAADVLAQVLIGRDADGQYLVPLDSPAGVGAVQHGSRSCDSNGGIVKTSDTLFQVVDTYRMKVEE